MTTALLGALGAMFAAVVGLVATLVTGRSPSHLADVQGMALLIDELQEQHGTDQADLAQARADLALCQQECNRLRRGHA